MTVSKDYLKKLFEYDREQGKLFWKIKKAGVTFGSEAGTTDKLGYRRIFIDYKPYLRHRLIWILETGADSLYFLDHINRQPGFDCITNLREVTASKNMWNRKANKNSTSQYKGVSWSASRNKWMAAIRVEGKSLNLGRFTTEEEAANAYQLAARKYFGEFAEDRSVRGLG